VTVFYWVPVVLLAGILLNALRLRRRLSGLHRLPTELGPVHIAHRFITAAGVDLDDATRRAASAFAAGEGIEVLDLVPGDLPSGRAFDFARMASPAGYRANRLAVGRTASHAVLVDTAVLERAGIRRLDGLDPVEFAELAVRLKRYACTSTDFAVAPYLRALADEPDRRLAVLRAVYGPAAWFVLTLPLLTYVLLVAGVLSNPTWGAAAALAFCAQPYLAFAGGPLSPRDLHQTALLRLAVDPLRWLGTLTGRWRPAPKPDPSAAFAARYAAEAAAGTDRLFEARRSTCPWCSSPALSVRLRTRDLVQSKPGRFQLDQCGDCGHIFQNPRLSVVGLDYYYRDFYDGLGEEQAEFMFGASSKSYSARAEMLRPFTTPKAWLDVGAGHGHFCNVAQDTWPDTIFDGLDMSESITEAERRRWINQAHRGMFPELANQLAGRYDVVSMHHYLEHTREPLAELDAARNVLLPGGHLLIEVPNPESRFGRLLGRLWVPWFQPQHQHFVPLANLSQALAERGFTPVAVDRGSAHIPIDFTAALALAINSFAPNPRQPWLGATPSRWRRAVSTGAMTLAIPLFVLTYALDQLLGLALRRTEGGNAYRILAVRNDD
jgi:SAM-dependent methyltransferase